MLKWGFLRSPLQQFQLAEKIRSGCMISDRSAFSQRWSWCYWAGDIEKYWIFKTNCNSLQPTPNIWNSIQTSYQSPLTTIMAHWTTILALLRNICFIYLQPVSGYSYQLLKYYYNHIATCKIISGSNIKNIRFTIKNHSLTKTNRAMYMGNKSTIMKCNTSAQCKKYQFRIVIMRGLNYIITNCCNWYYECEYFESNCYSACWERW